MAKKNFGISFVIVSILLAIFYLVKFAGLMAHTTGWTNGQAENWDVFSSGLDAIILVLVIILMSVGTFLTLRLKNKWVSLPATFLAGFATWLIFYMIQLGLQQHFSGFRGV